jgi:hypothetical protein
MTWSWGNQEATDEHRTTYLYTRSGETQLVYKYIFESIADKGVWSTLNWRGFYKGRLGLRLIAKERIGWA